MSKFTRGPWVVSASWSPPNGGFSIHGGSDSYIADVYAGHHKDDEVTKEIGTANARLIAASPELYAMVTRLLERAGQLDPFTESEARALLKRIDGK